VKGSRMYLSWLRRAGEAVSSKMVVSCSCVCVGDIGDASTFTVFSVSVSVSVAVAVSAIKRYRIGDAFSRSCAADSVVKRDRKASGVGFPGSYYCNVFIIVSSFFFLSHFGI
jgi:hypothetical protein